MACKTEVVNRQHQLPRASGRRYKKQAVHVCLGCSGLFYVDKITRYNMECIGITFEWVEVPKKE